MKYAIFLFLINLFILIVGANAQEIQMSSALINNKLILKLKNKGSKSVYIPSTFQNYRFFYRGIQDKSSNSMFASVYGSGTYMFLSDSSDSPVYLVHPNGDAVPFYRKIEKKSYFYKKDRPFKRQLTAIELVNKININGMCLNPGDEVPVVIKLHRSIYNKKSYRNLSGNKIKLRVQFGSFVTRSELNDPLVSQCDTVFHGWLYSSDTIQFRPR